MSQPVLLITGGSRGIGAATARLAARRGYAVCINYVNNHVAAQSLVAEITEASGRACCVQADVSVPADVERLFSESASQLGELSVLVNNAAIIAPLAKLVEMDVQRLRSVFDTNVLGAFLCAQHAVRRMSTLHGGVGGNIVNVSSGAARLGSPAAYIDYAASKGAIDTLTYGLGREVAAEGIRVNAVRPGFIETEMHAASGDPDRLKKVAVGVPLGRAGQAEEVAEAILWLASDAASYCVGTILDVTGGH